MSSKPTINRTAIAEWRASGGRGASATSLVDFIADGVSRGDYPHDAGDFGRCERALDATGLRDLLPRAAAMNAYWAALVPRWDEIAAAPDRSATIRAIIGPIEKADPSCARIGPGLMRMGGDVTFGADEKTVAEAMQAADRRGHNKPPMKNTPQDEAVSDRAYGIASAELRQFIEQFEQMEAEKAEVAERQKELMAEAKARGFDTKVMRKVIALRKRDKNDVAEEEATLDLYKAALGMG